MKKHRGFLLLLILVMSNIKIAVCQCDHIKIKKRTTGTYEVPVTINGKITINFIFDTGCSKVYISPGLFNTLKDWGGVDSSDSGGYVISINPQGKQDTCKVIKLDSIRLGNTTIYNVSAVVSNSAKANMLLGQNVLVNFGKYLFDYQKPLLVLGDCAENPQISILSPNSDEIVEQNLTIKGKSFVNSNFNYLIIEWNNIRIIEPIRIIHYDGNWSQNITLGDINSKGVKYSITAVTSEKQHDDNMSFSTNSYYSNTITIIRK